MSAIDYSTSRSKRLCLLEFCFMLNPECPHSKKLHNPRMVLLCAWYRLTLRDKKPDLLSGFFLCMVIDQILPSMGEFGRNVFGLQMQLSYADQD